MNYIILFFIILMLFAGWLNQRNKFLAYGLIVLYFVLVCFSYDSYDYINYTRMYEIVTNGGVLGYEPLFLLLMKLGGMLGLDYFTFRIICTAIELCLIQSTVKRYCGSNAFVWSMFIIFPGWLLTTLFRFSLGMSVVVFGLRYLIDDDKFLSFDVVPSQKKLLAFFAKNNWIKYILCVSIAALIHSSLWIMLVLVAAKFLKTKWLLVLSISFAGIGGALYAANLVNFLSSIVFLRAGYLERINSGITRNTNGLIYSALRQMLIFCSGWLPAILYKPVKNPSNKLDHLKNRFMNMVLPINSAAILFFVIAFFSSNTRPYHLIILFNIMAYAISINSREKRTLQTALLKFAALGEGLLLSFLMIHFESETVFDLVLKMLFETNDFINFLN